MAHYPWPNLALSNQTCYESSMKTTAELNQANLTALQDKLSKNLALHLRQYGPRHEDFEIYSYSLFPAGKLFRPTLAVLANFQSGEETENITDYFSGNTIEKALAPTTDLAYLASFLEMHHVYTLIHDDLPAMDNDDVRRGRPANHKKFNEWKALLAGDGLSILSFHLLSRIQSPQAMNFIKIATKCTGAHGLIYGQYLDLDQQMQNSFSKVKQTHILKTSRLIQLALLGGQLFSSHQLNHLSAQYWKLGESLGLVFQLLDDLDDLKDDNIHEQSINPWKLFNDKSLRELLKHLDRIKIQVQDKSVLSQYLQSYFDKNSTMLKNDLDNYIENCDFSEETLLQIIAALDLTSNH